MTQVEMCDVLPAHTVSNIHENTAKMVVNKSVNIYMIGELSTTCMQVVM